MVDLAVEACQKALAMISLGVAENSAHQQIRKSLCICIILVGKALLHQRHWENCYTTPLKPKSIHTNNAILHDSISGAKHEETLTTIRRIYKYHHYYLTSDDMFLLDLVPIRQLDDLSPYATTSWLSTLLDVQ